MGCCNLFLCLNYGAIGFRVLDDIETQGNYKQRYNVGQEIIRLITEPGSFYEIES